MTTHTTTKAIGDLHENRALKFLQARGLKLIERNYHNKTGEIDLIMDDHGVRVFIEVRFRTPSRYSSSLESITPQKQQRIRRTALLYLQENKLCDKIDCRIDVVAIDGDAIQWLKDII